MITEEIIAGLLAALLWFCNLLPYADNAITLKYEAAIDWIYTHLIILSYYYLPMTSINWWFHQTVTFLLAVLGLRLLADIVAAFTPVKLPWRR